MPPPAELFASRVLLGPALRAQPDRRLVTLVREGYEAAFEEIVRRYRQPLDRFAAAIVGGRSEDVTQDAFSKALTALQDSEAEIELRPWLYRIVRNTALNDLRDSPAAAEELGETIAGAHSAAVEAEHREEMAELMQRLRALPEPQRAAIVMRELEGLSHEEIAAALGVSGGAARQAIHRARTALRDGLGLLLPLPLLRLLFEHAGAAEGAVAAGVAGGGSAGAALGGLGTGGAIKVGVAAALIAGSVGAGVAVQENHGQEDGQRDAAAAAVTAAGSTAKGTSEEPLTATARADGGVESRPGSRGHGPRGPSIDGGARAGSGPVAVADAGGERGPRHAGAGPGDNRGPGKDGHRGAGPPRPDNHGGRHGSRQPDAGAAGPGHRGGSPEAGGKRGPGVGREDGGTIGGGGPGHGGGRDPVKAAPPPPPPIEDVRGGGRGEGGSGSGEAPVEGESAEVDERSGELP